MDNEFWKRFVSGDLSALSEIYEQYAPILYAYGMKIAQSRQMVDDCIQDLFLYIYDKRRSISNPPNMKAYLLLSFKRRIFLQMSEESKVNARSVSLDNGGAGSFKLTVDVQKTKEETELKEEQIMALETAISELSPQQREVIYLRYYHKLDVSEVSVIMNISKQTVMNVACTAISKLKKNELLSAVVLMGFILFMKVFFL